MIFAVRSDAGCRYAFGVLCAFATFGNCTLRYPASCIPVVVRETGFYC